MSEAILKIVGLRTYLAHSGKINYAVDGVDFEIMNGETLGLVGESGCGKTMIAKLIMGMVPGKPGIVDGEIWLSGVNLIGKNRFNNGKFSPNIFRLANYHYSNWKHNKMASIIRSKEVGIVFQDPESSMDPLFNVKSQVAEVADHLYDDNTKFSLKYSKRKQYKKMLLGQSDALLEKLGVNIKDNLLPRELSGGMLQRVSIASAVIGKPSFLIADEPTTALDVTIQAKVLSLIQEIKQSINLSILLIGHDMSVISALADKVAVMYNGKIMEFGKSEILLDEGWQKKHPYTLALLKSVPSISDKELPRVYRGMSPILQCASLAVDFLQDARRRSH